VIALTDDFTSMYGLELLATVHWTVTHEHTTRRDDIIASIRHWTPRKAALFTDNHIDAALAHLSSQNWLPSADAYNTNDRAIPSGTICLSGGRSGPPSHLSHLGAEIPNVLVRTCEVITIDGENTYARSHFGCSLPNRGR
jgi:hypothetical protein